MATTQVHVHESDHAPLDIPNRREYVDEEDEAVDRALCEAINAARAAGKHSLQELLTYELGSHYYRTRP